MSFVSWGPSNMGRPPIFKTPEEMQSIIDQFFSDHVPVVEKDKDGNVLVDGRGNNFIKLNPPTITGLALALGFNSRSTIYEYEKKNDEFSDTIKKARLRCENFIEKNLYSGNLPCAAGIFALKNYGWRDTQHIDDLTDRSEFLKEVRQISENFIKEQNEK